MTLKNLKIALVTDWLTNLGGGEKVLQNISELFPESPIFTTVSDYKKIGYFQKKNIKTSFLQKIPFFNKRHQYLLPLLPYGIESLDLSKYDLVISFSSSIAKNIITTPEQTHICYIHSPMRYAWEPFFDKRFKDLPKIFKPFIAYLLHHLRIWDKSRANSPDLYISNSSTTQKRVKKYYQKESLVLYPPVNSENFSLEKNKKKYFLGLGRMVNYKKFDLLVETFKGLPDKELYLVGDGPERKKLQKISKQNKNIKFFPKITQTELKKMYQEAQFFLLPQKEDAGIVQLEAMSCGTPVIAFKEGGALDVLKENLNGVFFDKQTPSSLKEAILKAEKIDWDYSKIRESILKYDQENFKLNFIKIIKKNLNKFD
jgi:glycosyltransferase involved in cell wall biosynthesis